MDYALASVKDTDSTCSQLGVRFSPSVASPHSGQWREHFAGVDLPVPVYGGATATGINFDNAASTPPLNRVRDMVTTFSDLYSSVHRGTGYKSRLSTEAYEQARELVAKFLGVDETDQVVIFVKGTTDALNRIAAAEARLDGRQVLVTEMEHHADLLPWRHRSGHMMVGLSDEGHIDLEAIEQALKTSDGKINLVAICGASNVTGFVSPSMKWPPWRIDTGHGFRSTPHSSRRITASTCERRMTPGTSISSRCQATRCTHPTARECWSRRAISSRARRR